LPGTHTQAFTPLGSSLEQEIYFIAVFAVTFYYVYRLIKSKTSGSEGAKLSQQELTKAISFGVASLIILMGIIVTTYSLFKLDKPMLLPAEA
jgi:uncharacterized membrane protein (DUF485 family)